MKKIVLVSIFILLVGSPSFAVDFMTSARGGGIGFSYFVLADDPSGAIYNPAGVGYIGGIQSYLMFDFENDYDYTVQEEDPYSGRFAVLYPLRDIGVIAINTNQSGSLEKITAVPTVNHGTVTYARAFAGWSAGASFKYLFETMYGERSAYDFDMGISYKSSLGVIASAAFENITRARMSPDYLGYKEYLPRRERFGLGYVLNSTEWQAAFMAAGQVEESGISEKHTTALMNIGSEWWLLPRQKVSLGLRTGFTFGEGVRRDLVESYSGLSGGLSVNFKLGVNDLRLDYGVRIYPYETSDGSVPIDHLLAFNYGWGGVPDYSFKQERKFGDDIEPVRPEVPERQRIDVRLEGEDEDISAVDKDTDFDAGKYLKYDIVMDVADISTAGFRRIVFYLRPQQILRTNNWKLYVFRAKIKNWNEEEIERWALKVIGGRGVPPLNVVWDGISSNGTLLPPGKYYYILTAEDVLGNSFATKWHHFKIE